MSTGLNVNPATERLERKASHEASNSYRTSASTVYANQSGVLTVRFPVSVRSSVEDLRRLLCFVSKEKHQATLV